MLLTAGALLVGCSESRTPSGPTPRLSGPSFTVGQDVTGTPAPEQGKIKICKVGNVSGTFLLTPTAGGGSPTPSSPTSVTIAAGSCFDVAEDFTTTTGNGTQFAITETSAGFVSATEQLKHDGITEAVVAYTQGTNLPLNFYHGHTLVFTNNVVVVNPPEGCSPGYYKKHEMPGGNLTLGSLFTNTGTASGVTLKAALDFKGGPTLQDAKNVLLRQAAAAYANSIRLAGYPLTTAQVIAQTNAALASGDRDTILAFAAVLDADNNLEGPNC
jgi:hypothetical protein